MPETPSEKESPPDFPRNKPRPPVLALENIKVPDEGGLVYGPLNLSLDPGEKVLVRTDNTSVVAALIRVILATRGPLEGRVFFQNKRMETRLDTLERAGLYKKIGLVCDFLGLIARLTVHDNILAYYLYHSPENPRELERRTRDLLHGLGFSQSLMDASFASLHKVQKNLASLALTLAKEPPLMLLERPKYRLGRFFPRSWERILECSAASGGAILALALQSEDYQDLGFDKTIDLLGG
ncbi:MAG: ATP-binding cassette domain-containing protein [Deltaproteobacteria bacterium]|jgi:ABC-type molybdenum transport system ATPase subunit/photorepair protein PhrA|nr:ATP-binding cassette domain-containing protein [Deltaproteobacteria bacterium]